MFVGLGNSTFSGLTIEGMEYLKRADVIYIDSYTSFLEEGVVNKVKEVSKAEVFVASREVLEEEYRIVRSAKDRNVVLLCGGDPLIATTHWSIRLRAKIEGVETKAVHASSIMTSIISETGLHPYRFGKMVSVAKSGDPHLQTVYSTARENLLRNLHTLILLPFFEGVLEESVMPDEAMRMMLEAEEFGRAGVFTEGTFILVGSRVGWKDQKIIIGSMKKLIGLGYTAPPYVLVLPSSLHFTEREVLTKYWGVPEEEIVDNSANVRSRCRSLLEKYYGSTISTLEKARELIGRERLGPYVDLLENVEIYAGDAFKFLNSGDELLAMLSIGYAEGLLDALRFLGIAKFSWR